MPNWNMLTDSKKTAKEFKETEKMVIFESLSNFKLGKVEALSRQKS